MKVLVTGSRADCNAELVESAASVLRESGLSVLVVAGDVGEDPFHGTARPLLPGAVMMADQIRSEAEAQQQEHRVVLCSGGVTDVFSALLNCPSIHDADEHLLGVVREMASSWSKTYDLTFWLARREFPTPADPLLVAREERYADTFSSLSIAARGFAENTLSAQTAEVVATINQLLSPSS